MIPSTQRELIAFRMMILDICFETIINHETAINVGISATARAYDDNALVFFFIECTHE